MSNREAVISAIDRYKIIAILRLVDRDTLIPAVRAMHRGGIRLMEVTFDQSGRAPFAQTAEQIAAIRESFGGEVLVGAGTVLTCEQVEIAHAAGADYIISPDVNPDVIARTRALDMVSIPGALTPTEAMTAHRAGADYVKLFPAGDLGISYIKSVKAPLSHLKFLAVGGIGPENIADFMACGICGCGIGSTLVNRKLLAAGDFDAITDIAARLCAGAGAE